MFHKRRFRRKFNTKHLSIAKKALRKVNKLARRVKPEQKIHDVITTSIQPNIAGLTNNLVSIAQGDTVSTRDGLSIRAFFWELRYSIIKDATPTNTVVRIIIVKDNRQVESTVPSVLDIILSADPLSQFSRVNPKRFTILYNRLLVLRTNMIMTKAVVTRKISTEIRYVGAAVNTVTKNGLFLITLSSAAAGEEPTMRFTWRLRFTDV